MEGTYTKSVEEEKHDEVGRDSEFVVFIPYTAGPGSEI